MESTWNKYYEKQEQGTPHKTALFALERFAQSDIQPGFCVDIGCGQGSDTLAAIHYGWTVLAIDKEKQALETLYNRVHHAANGNPELPERLKLYLGEIEQLDWPQNQFTNASLSLPFCAPSTFQQTWQRVLKNLTVGGRFAGHFFGIYDTWAAANVLVHHTRAQVEQLFEDFELELLEEQEYDGLDIHDAEKHWHIIHVVAQKLR